MKMPTAQDLKRWDSAYREVMGLYLFLKDTSAEALEGAEHSDAPDFLSDVELKAKRALGDPLDYRLFLEIIGEARIDYLGIPFAIRTKLGQEFSKAKLTRHGVYRRLYWRNHE
jgi:hypothetical protein